jgi:hypothetical protein
MESEGKPSIYVYWCSAAWVGCSDENSTWEPEEYINGADNLIGLYWKAYYSNISVIVRDFQATSAKPHEEFYTGYPSLSKNIMCPQLWHGLYGRLGRFQTGLFF